MCIGVCVTQHVLNLQNAYKRENERLKNALEQEESNIRRIEELYEKNNIIRHDLKHYSLAIRAYLNNKEYDKIQCFLDDIVEKQMDTTVYYTSDKILNAVLNNKNTICQKNDIRFDVEIITVIPKDMSVNICVILSNLLDNAIRAEKEEKEKYISLKINLYNDMLNILLQNNISKSVIENNPDFITTKPDAEMHGFGIKSVKNKVSDMDGIYKISEKNNRFINRISIPVN